MWLIKDPYGVFLSMLTLLLIIGTAYSVIEYGIRPLESCEYRLNELSLAYLGVAFLALISHIVCCLKDPGSLSLSTSRDIYESLLDNSNEPTTCERCGCWKAPRVHHCGICNKCIINMDHHCPWVNNCVGIHTQKLFILFLLYTFIGSCMSFVIMLSRIFLSGSEHKKINGPELFLSSLTLVLIMFFALMTSSLLHGQFKALRDNSSYIDELQGKKYERRRFSENFTEVFGRNWLIWALPIPPNTRPRKVVMILNES